MPESRNNNNNTIREVSYDEAATKLFLAIEGMEWRDAFDIISLDPEQVRTWVNNSGSEGTNAFWRRLPIHEACIRRAPAWLVSELLSAFPESSSLTTNLGEYPLHLAVDKACAPEVVNLVIVANWDAIVARDHAGRTPLDIIDHTELLEIDENKVIFESLKRCHKTYTALQKSARDEKAVLLRKQKAQACVVIKRNQEEQRKQKNKITKLTEETERLKIEIDVAREQTRKQDREIEKRNLVNQEYEETIRELHEKTAAQKCELENERAQIKGLLYKVEQKEAELKRKNSKIDVLSKDLQSIVVSNETEIMHAMIETEQSMRTMVSAQINLQNLLNSKSQGLKTLLNQRGIDAPRVQNLSEEPDEEKSMGEEDDQAAYAVDDATANAAMMAAATAALKTMA